MIASPIEDLATYQLSKDTLMGKLAETKVE